MYVYGGVTLRAQNKTRVPAARVPADNEAGLVHAFDFATYTWTVIRTTGAGCPANNRVITHPPIIHALSTICCS